MSTSSIPEGHHAVAPRLIVPNVESLLDFVKGVFDAKEVRRIIRPDAVLDAHVLIGDSIVMMQDPDPTTTTATGSIHVYVDDVDGVFARALANGAAPIKEPTDEVFGDRCAGFKDGSGNVWWVATHREDVPPEEISKRMFARMPEAGGEG